MGKHSHNRSPKWRDKYDRDRKESDSSRRHDRNRDQHSRSVKKDIDSMKKNLKNKMDSAIHDIRRLEQSDSRESNQFDNECTLSAPETARRTSQIGKIEEAGFTPATFVSSRGGKRNQPEQKLEDLTKNHDGSIFGPAWKSKELTKKLEKQTISRPFITQPSLDSIPLPQFDPDFDDFPLAKQWLNADPEARRQNWLKTYHEQRRKLFEGCL